MTCRKIRTSCTCAHHTPRRWPRPGPSRTGGTAPAGQRPCADQGQGPATASRPNARAGRPGCGPCAAPAPRNPAHGAPRGAVPYVPMRSFEPACPDQSYPFAAAAPAQPPAAPAVAPLPHRTQIRRSSASFARSAASSTSFASTTACSRANSARCSPAAPDGSGSSDIRHKLAQPEPEVQTPRCHSVSQKPPGLNRPRPVNGHQ
jgi:hypothetical protein